MTDSSVSTTSNNGFANPARAVAPTQRRPALVVIVLANFLFFFGYRLWQSLFSNFAVQGLGVRADQMGLIQSIREIPGLLGFSVGLLALLLVEMRIAGLSVVLMGIGIALTGRVGSLSGLVMSTLMMSIGFHFFMSSNSSAVLLLVGDDEAPRTLGRLSSVGALAALAGAGIVFLALDALGFRTLFYVTGALLIVGGLVLLPWTRQPVHPVRTRRRTPIRRRYWLYYVLEFLMGSRRHIFTTFAIFLLVQEHRVTAQTITVLFVVNDLIGTSLYRQFGGIIIRFGERRVLTLNFVFLIFVFLGYAYIPLLPVLYVLFVADQVLFGFRISLQSYFQKIAVRPQEITPNISLGQTINHIAAVIIPVVGGMVWEVVGSRYTFLIGVGVAVLSLVLVQWMHTERSDSSGLRDG
ncbi:MAG: MFS transporter [Anaerolineae bacterium]|nr:MFS transporter [Anaerolineae bacterium]